MFPLNSNRNYYLYREATDMRKSFNGLSGLVQSELGRELLGGDVFIFINRRRDRIKLLVWDRTGFVIYYKCLEEGTFELPQFDLTSKSCLMKWDELLMILEGITLKSVHRRKRFDRSKTGVSSRK